MVLERVSCEEKGHGALRPCSALTPSSLETEDRLTWPHPCTTKEPVLLKRCPKGEYENGLCLSIQVLVWGVLFCFVVSSLIVHKVLISRGRVGGGEKECQRIPASSPATQFLSSPHHHPHHFDGNFLRHLFDKIVLSGYGTLKPFHHQKNKGTLIFDNSSSVCFDPGCASFHRYLKLMEQTEVRNKTAVDNRGKEQRFICHYLPQSHLAHLRGKGVKKPCMEGIC